MRNSNIIPKQYRWAILLVIATLLLITPLFLREMPFNDLTYERIKVQDQGKLNFYTEDTLVKGGRVLVITPYDLLVMLLKDIPKITLILPLIFGLLSVILFKFFLKEFNVSENR